MSENNTFNNLNFVFNKNEGVSESISINTSTVGISLQYDKNTANPKIFSIRPAGVNFTDNTNNITTGLERLASVQQAFQSVQLPPNATTLKINNTVLVDAGVVNKTTSVNDGSIVVNNNTGGTVVPAITLNQTGSSGGILVEEIYNQRTATTGEFNRFSFHAKNSTGAKIEFARMHQNAPIIINGNERGRMDFGVREANLGIVDYIRLNGNTQTVEMGRSINMQNNNLSNASTVSATLGNFFVAQNSQTGLIYKPSEDQVVNTINATIPVPQFNGQRLFVFSEGITDPASSYIDPSPISPSPQSDNYCCAFFGGYVFVGMGQNLNYWDYGSSNWVTIYQFNSNIHVMSVFNGYLYIGGKFVFDSTFSTQFNHFARMDSGFSVNPISWSNRSGDVGFDDIVDTICPNDIGNNYLYVGGQFRKTGTTNSYPLVCFGCIDTISMDLYAIDDNSGGGSNGFSSPVKCIACYSNRIFIGGEFTSQTASIFGSQNTYFNQFGCFWTSNDYISLNSPEFENVGNSGSSSLNNYIYKAVKDPTGNPYIHFGGDFTSLDATYNYLAYVDANSPTSVSGTNPFSQGCYSLDVLGTNTIVAKEGASNGQIFFVLQNYQISPSSPNGTMSACVDNNTGIYQFFFSGATAITAFNPTNTTTIDLAAIGIGIIKNGVTYFTNAVILNATGYIYGIAVMPNSVSPVPCYVVVNDYVVNYS